MITRLLILFLVFTSTVFAQQRIISLAPSLTQNLYLLEAEQSIVGYTNYCEEAVKGNKPIIASAVKVNLEKVATLSPDIVFATTITNPETIKQLETFGIKVMVYKTPESFDQICAQFLEMGKVIGKSAIANKIVRESKSKVDSIRNSVLGKEPLKILFQIGANPLYCVPPKTFMNDFITMVGGENIQTTPGNGSINRESVMVKNPDVIFVTAMGIHGDGEKKVWSSYTNLEASKFNNIHVLESNKCCSPTPVTFVETLDTIVHLIR